MLRCEISEAGVNLHVNGCTMDICVDTMVFLQTIYDELEKGDKKSADMFYEAIRDNLKYIKERDAFKKEVEKRQKIVDEKMKKVTDLTDEIESLIEKLKAFDGEGKGKNEE